ncbi:MAG TPA: tetratricopeptide repeat protein [Candidatus Sulfopaludibacter sp.]|jgi:tetratricopeptide (TPR) repeat protein|nr:tetratricopeptide repeat protein [Candidatus Sulfopaludibacter sp.]
MRERLVLLTAALLAFGASLGSGFHFDDYAIFADPALNRAAGWLQIWSLRQTRPLTYFTFWLNLQTSGHSAAGFHALNLALHLGAVLLAYECLRRLLPEGPALFAAAVFAVHPLQAEAVDYIWGRSIVLATLLCLASLLAWLRGARWQAVAWFAAALLAKEEVAAFPLVLLLLDRRARAPIAAMCGLSLAAGLRVVWATAVTPGAPAGLQAGISPWHYFLTQGTVIWRYLRLLAIPWGFTIDPQIAVAPVWVGVAAWTALAAAVALMWRHRAGPWILAGLVLLLPSSSIFPAADLAADRRMYFPLLAFAAALLPVKKQIAAPVILVLMGLSFARTQVWMSDESLWREAVERAPDKVRPKIQLARAVPPAEGLQLLAAARAEAPEDPNIATETGKILLSAGQPAEALGEFGRALALQPRDAANYNNRGAALAALGQTEAARQDFERALKLDPTLVSARQNLQSLR